MGVINLPQQANVMTDHINSTLPDTLDTFNFPYRLNRFTDDTITIVMHTALSHLDKRNSYVGTLFIQHHSTLQAHH